MKRTVVLVLLALTVALAAICLSACGGDGKNGVDGINGKSAYEIWLDNGYTGTELDFLDWLKGQDGKNGEDGTNGDDGKDGLSAYDIWLADGHSGTEADFLDWLRGRDGVDGYVGADGKDGKSAYETFLQYNPDYYGTEEQWINALAKGRLVRRTITFKAVDEEDIVKTVFYGFDLTDIPSVPEKYGNSGVWDITDFTNITQDMTVTAQYTTDCLIFNQIPNSTEYEVRAPEQAGDLEYVKIPETHNGKRVVAIADYAFKGATKLKTVVLNDDVRSIGYFAFADCKNLVNINISDRVSEINSSFGYDLLPNLAYTEENNAYYLGDEYNPYMVLMRIKDDRATEFTAEYGAKIVYACAFEGCSALSQITLSDYTIQVGERAFKDCVSLGTFDLPRGIRTIGEQAFSGCIALTEIKLPRNFRRIERLTFQDCSALQTVIIPVTLAYVDNAAFWGCDSLQTVYYGGTEQQKQEITIDDGSADGVTPETGNANAPLLGAKWYYESELAAPY